MNIAGFRWPWFPKDLVLNEKEVHLWQVWLEVSDNDVRKLSELISTDELRRASRFYFDRYRKNAIAGRGILRILLGAYLNVPASEIQFRYSSKGKPDLAVGCGDGSLFFNTSQSHNLALIGISRNQNLGVDVEYLAPVTEMSTIVDLYFSANEKTIFQDLPDDRKLNVFYRYWTCKEAYLKAIGDGLAYPFEKLEVSFQTQNFEGQAFVKTDLREACCNAIFTLSPEINYVGALAVLKKNDDGFSSQKKCLMI